MAFDANFDQVRIITYGWVNWVITFQQSQDLRESQRNWGIFKAYLCGIWTSEQCSSGRGLKCPTIGIPTSWITALSLLLFMDLLGLGKRFKEVDEAALVVAGGFTHAVLIPSRYLVMATGL